jgi:radical SAM protein with 4Fe4S-binding SPASM domain
MDSNRGQGTFAKVVRNMALLQGLRIPFQIRMTIAPDRTDTLGQNLAFINALGHEFRWCMDTTRIVLEPGNIEKILAILLDFYHQTNVNDQTLWSYLRKKGRTHCIDPYQQITIDPAGNLCICSRADWQIGNIQDGITAYAEVSRLPFYSGQPLETCATCLVYEHCKGGCIGAHFEKNKEKTINYRLNDNFCKEMFLLQMLNENLNLGQQYNELRREAEEILS